MFSSPLIIRTSDRLEVAMSEMRERSLQDAAGRGVLLTERAESVWVLDLSEDVPRGVVRIAGESGLTESAADGDVSAAASDA